MIVITTGVMTLVENWRPVVGYEGIYEVSDRGRVRSLPRMRSAVIRGTACEIFVRGRIMRPAITHGYARLTLRDQDRQRQTFVHALVAEAFLGPRPDGYVIDHVDCVRDNNHVRNLRYVTPFANLAVQYGENVATSKLTNDCAARVFDALMEGRAPTDIAKEFGVTCSNVVSMAKGKTWSHHPKSEAARAAYAAREHRNIPDHKLAMICSALSNRNSSMADIAKKFDVPTSTVTNVHRGKIYADRQPVIDYMSRKSSR